jgi:hypothetical protein
LDDAENCAYLNAASSLLNPDAINFGAALSTTVFQSELLGQPPAGIGGENLAIEPQGNLHKSEINRIGLFTASMS